MDDPNAVIGQVIARHAPQGWQRAWVRATADDGYIGDLTAHYTDAEGHESWFAISGASDAMALSRALLALRERMRQDGQPGFSACTFTLQRDGTFRLDVHYGDQPAG